MERARWRDRIGPPFVALLTALLVTAAMPPNFAAALLPLVPAAGDCSATSPAAAARAALGPLNTGARDARVDGRLDERGALTSRVLSVPRGPAAPLPIALPVESSVGPTIGNLIVYTQYTAENGSEVRALNVATGCDVRLASPAEIVRSATLSPTADALYFHSVNRAGRADAGVTRHDLATGALSEVVAPLSPTDSFGPIFGTDLRWSIAGDALAVQSCGFSECLTRVLDVASGAMRAFEGGRQGAFIALTRGNLVTYAACPGLPCPVLATDLASGAVETLADDAFATTVTPTGSGGARLAIQTTAGNVELDV